MYNLKGFIEITAFANNVPDFTSPLGELSNTSKSYSKEQGYFSKAGAADVKLVSFTSKRDDNKVEVPVKYHANVLTIAQWVFDKSVAGALSDDDEAFRTLLLAEFQSQIIDVECGKMVYHNGNWMPSFISWSLDDDQEENEIRVWFADDAFKAQYDDYEIIVIPPLEPVDTFQKTIQFVKPILDEFNMPDHHKKVLEKTHGIPYTYLVTREYDWYDREDPTATLPTNWSVAIYGIAGKNPLVIKDAIANFILENSAYSRDDWIPVFPDIFTSTEFLIVPMWHKLSVPNETVRGQLYSPIVPYDEVPAIANQFMQYPVAGHVMKHLEILPVHYKSIACLSVGGIENRNDVFRISQQFPRYALIQTTSRDFNFMDKDTTEWIRMLITAVITAEEMDEYSYLDVDYARVERDGLMYVGFSYDDILYLVLSRTSMLEAMAEPN